MHALPLEGQAVGGSGVESHQRQGGCVKQRTADGAAGAAGGPLEVAGRSEACCGASRGLRSCCEPSRRAGRGSVRCTGSLLCRAGCFWPSGTGGSSRRACQSLVSGCSAGFCSHTTARCQAAGVSGQHTLPSGELIFQFVINCTAARLTWASAAGRGAPVVSRRSSLWEAISDGLVMYFCIVQVKILQSA